MVALENLCNVVALSKVHLCNYKTVALCDLSTIDRYIRSLDKKNKGQLILFQFRSERTDHILVPTYF